MTYKTKEAESFEFAIEMLKVIQEMDEQSKVSFRDFMRGVQVGIQLGHAELNRSE